MLDCIANRQVPLIEIAKEMGLEYPRARRLRDRAISTCSVLYSFAGVAPSSPVGTLALSGIVR